MKESLNKWFGLLLALTILILLTGIIVPWVVEKKRSLQPIERQTWTLSQGYTLKGIPGRVDFRAGSGLGSRDVSLIFFKVQDAESNVFQVIQDTSSSQFQVIPLR